MYIAVLIAIYITQVVAIELYVSVSIYVALLCRHLSVDNLLCVRSMFLEPFICSISTKDCHMMYMQTINTIVLKCVVYLWKYDPQLSNSFVVFSIFYRLCTFFFINIVWNVAMQIGLDNMLHIGIHNITIRTTDYCILIHTISITSYKNLNLNFCNFAY